MSTAPQILECAEQELPGMAAPDRRGRSRYNLSLVRQKIERQEAAIRELLAQAVASGSRDDWDLLDELDYVEALLDENSTCGDDYHHHSLELIQYIRGGTLFPVQKNIIHNLRLALRLQASILDDLETAEQRSIQSLAAPPLAAVASCEGRLREPFPLQ